MASTIDQHGLGKGSGWVCVYPVYINKDRTLAKGRKVSKEYACSNPTAGQIAEVADKLNLPAKIMRYKRHPRDPFTFGRVHIQLWQNGAFVHDTIQSRKALFRELGTRIPTLASRIAMEKNIARMKDLKIKQAAEKAAVQNQTGSTKKSRKKKNRKKKKR
eukprot:g1715.t1